MSRRPRQPAEEQARAVAPEAGEGDLAEASLRPQRLCKSRLLLAYATRGTERSKRLALRTGKCAAVEVRCTHHEEQHREREDEVLT